MLKNFIFLIDPITTVVVSSKNKAFKNNKLSISSQEIDYLKSVLKILEIFNKPIIKLQGEEYPTLYYTIPLVYNLYIFLDKLNIQFKVSFL